jgi:4-hydroxy-tetrahydrodipicolinate synthase
MAEGGDGVVSVTSNVVPKLAAQVVELWDSGDVKGARDLAHRLAAWTTAAFIESNPLPAKAALAMMGKLENVLRLPLVPMKDSHADAVREALVAAGALSK